MKFDCGLEKDRSGIDMIPLIDVVFLLLVFFIYAMLSMTVHRGINIRLPRVSDAPVITEDFIAISINERNEMFLDETPVEIEQILPLLDARGMADARTRVSIYGDSGSQLGAAVMLLDYLRKHGFENVSISVERMRDGYQGDL